MAPSFLTSARAGGERSASRPWSLPTGKSPQYPFDRLGGSQSLSRHCEVEKIYTTPSRNLNPAVQPMAITTELSRLHLLLYRYILYLRHYATSWKVAGSIPDEIIGFSNRPKPSSRTMTLGSTQPLTEMSARNLPGGKGRPARKTDNLTAICEPIV
jgi:hypothetical protein